MHDRTVTIVPAVAVAATGLGVLAAGDVWLIRTRRRPVTDAARTLGGWSVIGYLVAHFARALGPLDLFTAIGRRLTPQETS